MNKKISVMKLWLTIIYVVCLLISNIVVFKTVQLPFGIICTGGEIVFPIVYILSDVFGEVYGYKWNRKTCWMAFSMNLLMVIVFQLTIQMPYPESFEAQDAYAMILGNTPRALIASLAALSFGDWVNDVVFAKMKHNESHEGFGIRAIFSSLVGETVDSLIVNTILFAGVLPINDLINLMVFNVFIKVGYEIIILPITTKVMKWVERKELAEETMSF